MNLSEALETSWAQLAEWKVNFPRQTPQQVKDELADEKAAREAAESRVFSLEGVVGAVDKALQELHWVHASRAIAIREGSKSLLDRLDEKNETVNVFMKQVQKLQIGLVNESLARHELFVALTRARRLLRNYYAGTEELNNIEELIDALSKPMNNETENNKSNPTGMGHIETPQTDDILDRFAMAAMSGWVAATAHDLKESSRHEEKLMNVAHECYLLADAMRKERARWTNGLAN